MSIYYPQQIGSWYDKDYDRQVKSLMKPYSLTLPSIAVISPHAGYTFSGNIAAKSYSQVQWNKISLIVILSTYHQQLQGLVLPRFSQIYYNPEDNLLVDQDLVSNLISTRIFRYDQGNEFSTEHAWENQIPFILINSRKHRSPILPVLVGAATLEELQLGGKILLSTIQYKYNLDNVLFAITTDFTHYGPSYGYQVPGSQSEIINYLNDKDFQDLSFILSRNILGFYNDAYTVCGKQAILMWMLMLPFLGPIKEKLEAVGRSQHGDNFVSYASIIYYSLLNHI